MENLSHLTLGGVLKHQAARCADRPALLSHARSLTWAELDDEVDRLVSLLHGLGVRANDAVGILLNKRPEVVTGFLACARLGAIVAPVNFKLGIDDVRRTLELAQVRTVLVEREFDPLLHGLLGQLPDPARILYVGGKGSYGESVYEAIEDVEILAVDMPDPNSPVYYNFTSGTTGRPKGAVTTHRQILANALTAFDRDGADGLGFTEDDTFLCLFSVFSHPHEIFHRSLLCGGAFLVLDTLSPRVVAQAVEKFGVSWMMAVPSFYEMLLDHVGDLGCDLGSLRRLEAGGAALSAGRLEHLEAAFGADLLPVWGSTETTGVALALRPDRPREPGTTGRPLSGYEVRVVDHRGRDCAPGVVGEMWVRGEGVCSGYVDNPDETAALFEAGWYATRDLVRWTDGGFVEFVGRRSEMLKIGGIRVYPLEIEQVLRQHPGVRNVVVVRAEERVRGEIARAVVQARTGEQLEPKKLARYCRDRMPVFKVPRIIEVWEEIPRLPNGKVDKKQILALAGAGG